MNTSNLDIYYIHLSKVITIIMLLQLVFITITNGIPGQILCQNVCHPIL